MNILIYLLIGLLSGWFAGLIMGGGGYGIIGDILLGIIGAFVGGFLFDVLGITTYGTLGAIVMAVIGAVIFIAVVRMLRRAGGSTHSYNN
jgi:uncharacterized membrane protein YeaQ/YmgE (transglycosylase-associated protein family)